MSKFQVLLQDNKHRKQITKLLYTVIVCVALLLLTEALFQIPAVEKVFSVESIGANGENIMAWVVLWLLMFAQVTIIPIPAMPIYVFCSKTNLVAFGDSLGALFSGRTLFFCLFVTSACVVGSITAYWLGRLGGGKAVKWIAGDEDDYKQWCSVLNNKKGKILYSATLLLPIFPDDLLCLVVGAMRMDFKFFVFVNIVFKFIGSFCMLIFLRLPLLKDFFLHTGQGFPWTLLIYAILLFISIIFTIVWKKVLEPRIQKKNEQQ